MPVIFISDILSILIIKSQCLIVVPSIVIVNCLILLSYNDHYLGLNVDYFLQRKIVKATNNIIIANRHLKLSFFCRKTCKGPIKNIRWEKSDWQHDSIENDSLGDLLSNFRLTDQVGSQKATMRASIKNNVIWINVFLVLLDGFLNKLLAVSDIILACIAK